MMLGARTAAWAKSGYTAKDYVQDGLVAMWDGIENAGWGVHDPNATAWKDLVGGLFDLELVGDYEIGDSFVSFSGSGYAKGEKLVNSGFSGMTLEEVIEPNSSFGFGSFGWSFAGGSGRRPTIFVNYPDDRMSSLMTGRVFDIYGSSISRTQKTVISCTGANSTASMFKNGVLDFSYTDTMQDFNNTDNKFLFGAYGSPSGGISGFTYEKAYCGRVYSRALSSDEIAHNYAIDAARFGIG